MMDRRSIKSWCASLALGVLLLGLQPATQASNGAFNVRLAPDAENAKIKHLSAQVSIDAPPALVWQTMTNYRQLKSILPGYKKSDVVQDNGTESLVDIAMKVNQLLPAYQYRVKVHENKSDWSLNFQRVSGDFNSLKANYKLLPKNGGRQTLLVYTLAIDPGSNMPGTGNVLKNNTQKTFEALQAYVEDSYRKSLTAQR